MDYFKVGNAVIRIDESEDNSYKSEFVVVDSFLKGGAKVEDSFKRKKILEYDFIDEGKWISFEKFVKNFVPNLSFYKRVGAKGETSYDIVFGISGNKGVKLYNQILTDDLIFYIEDMGSLTKNLKEGVFVKSNQQDFLKELDGEDYSNWKLHFQTIDKTLQSQEELNKCLVNNLVPQFSQEEKLTFLKSSSKEREF